MSSIQLVVFDIAGTTVHDKGNVADSFLSAFRDFGFEMPRADVQKVMGFRKIDAIAILLDKFAPGQKDDEALIDRIHTRFIDSMIAFYKEDEALAPLPHAEKVFSTLQQRGTKVALNTGFTRSITDAILHRLRWDGRNKDIDQVICSDEVAHGRPYPDMINTLIAALGIDDTAGVLKIGDTEVDVQEGRNASCGVVVSITTGTSTREELLDYHPDHIIDDLDQLLPIIEKV